MPLHNRDANSKLLSYWIFGLVIVAIVYHWSVWLLVHASRQITWARLLNHWDAGWYTDIILNGYKDHNFAFFPFYPSLISSVRAVLHLQPGVELIGAWVSTGLFLIYGLLIAILARKNQDPAAWGILPPSPLAWFFMVWSPASYIFQSHHTEATFLLLSVTAFLLCQNQKFVLASLCAGLCAVTKNQGIFVAISVGFWWAQYEKNWLSRLRNFILSGLLSGPFFLIFLLYSYWKKGDLMAFYTAQSHWRPEMTQGSYFKALWFGNPWQNTNLGSIERYILFWLMALSLVAIWKKHKPLGLYAGLFIGVMPLSGEFVGTFRYATVLWPVWFTLADKLLTLPSPLRKWTIAFVIFIFLYYNHQLTLGYGLGRWVY